MGFHAKTKPPRSGNSEGVLVLVLTALTHQAVKPLAKIVCYYFCCDSLEKRDKIIHMGFHLLSTCCEAEKGRSASITHALTQYNKKPPGIPTTGGLCFVHCMNPMDKFSSPYLSLVYALWCKSQGCTRKFTIYFALGNALFQVSITLNFGVQPSGLKVSALLASMMPCSAFPLSAGIFVVIFLRSSKNLCHF